MRHETSLKSRKLLIQGEPPPIIAHSIQKNPSKIESIENRMKGIFQLRSQIRQTFSLRHSEARPRLDPLHLSTVQVSLGLLVYTELT